MKKMLMATAATALMTTGAYAAGHSEIKIGIILGEGLKNLPFSA